MDLKIRQFEDSLIELTNAFDIPMEAKRLVLKDILSLVERNANAAIAMQLKEKETKEDERI